MLRLSIRSHFLSLIPSGILGPRVTLRPPLPGRIRQLSSEALAPKTSKHQPSQRLYIGNLPFETTETEVREVLEQHGSVEDIYILKDEDGQSRGYGFALFSSLKDASSAFESSNKIGHRLMRIDYAAAGKLKPQSMVSSSTIFVGNLPSQATAEDLRSLFAPYGSLRGIRVPLDQDGRSRRFAHVEYDLESDAVTAMEMFKEDPLNLGGRRLRLDFALPYVPKVMVNDGDPGVPGQQQKNVRGQPRSWKERAGLPRL
ncbi:hypothetical protein MIND_00424600 [Mycena indigotica]|uniref:RRM domain-containing protein n=1 Tax=Mycena indigotica TaxID=2126181 RepID=A0A8H6SVV8_9AGAR|nr:uncharacterized protein MIND_00424600 [Mycena indigotica]KAF7306334.1 hypothetical protein MIND_00424600 [Mycena indigotica]